MSEETKVEEVTEQATEETDKAEERVADASEAKRFEEAKKEAPALPEGIDDRFVKDGELDVNSLAKSYGELNKKLMTKTEELKAQLKEELAGTVPEAADKYELPELEGVDPDEVANHPMYQAFREKAFADKMSNEQFSDVVSFYFSQQKPVEMKELQKELGENASARIEAADRWLEKQPESVQAKIKLIATDAEGIKLVEALMGTTSIVDPLDDTGGQTQSLDEKALRHMQEDPRYWDTARRDPAFVKQIEDGWRALYPKKT